MSKNIAKREIKIKAEVLQFCRTSKLLGEHHSIASEFSLSSSSRRADLVLIAPDELHVFEIKSHADNLSRLAGQAEAYLQFCDLVTIVVAEKFLKSARALLPRRAGIWVHDDTDIHVIRKPMRSASRSKEDYISLLTVKGLRKLISSQKLKTCSTRRSEMISVVRRLPLNVIRDATIDAIRAKYEETTLAFRAATAKRKVQARDIRLLSIYAGVRAQLAQHDMANRKFWENWATQMEAVEINSETTRV